MACEGAAAGQGVHDRADVPLIRGRAAAVTASTGSCRSRRSARPSRRRREVIEFYVELCGQLGVTEWELRLDSIGDANCRPQYVARLNEWLDAQPRSWTRTRGTSARRARSRSSTSGTRPCSPRSPRLRRSASRSATLAASTSTRSGAVPRRERSPVVLDPTLVRGSTTTRARPSSSSGPRRTSTRRSVAAGATTASSRRRRAGDPGHRVRRRPRAAAARDRSGGSDGRRAALDVFVAERWGRRAARALPQIAELRRGGPRRHRLRGPFDEGADAPGAAGGCGDRRRRAHRRTYELFGAGRSDRSCRALVAHLMALERRMRGEWRAEDAGRSATVAGWVDTRRDHGGLVFVELRDHTGKGSARHQPGALARRGRDSARDPERVRAPGDRRGRGPRAGDRQPELPTGQIELQVDELRDPLALDAAPVPARRGNVDETLRLRYRWLDMRTDRMQRNLRSRRATIVRDIAASWTSAASSTSGRRA